MIFIKNIFFDQIRKIKNSAISGEKDRLSPVSMVLFGLAFQNNFMEIKYL